MHKTQSIPRCTNQQSLTLFLKRVTARLANSVKLPTSVRKNLPQRRNVDSRTKCRHCFGWAGIRQPGGAHKWNKFCRESISLPCSAAPHRRPARVLRAISGKTSFHLSYACASTIYGLPHETGRDVCGANVAPDQPATPDRRTFLDNRCHNHDGC
jgi:hypothetical protein